MISAVSFEPAVNQSSCDGIRNQVMDTQLLASSLIGIEEPETALHPAAAGALREALERASEKTQVLVTSHSPDLLDDSSIEADNILVVSGDRGETRIAEIDPASKSAIQKHLFSAGELLRMDQLASDPAALFGPEQGQLDLFSRF